MTWDTTESLFSTSQEDLVSPAQTPSAPGSCGGSKMLLRFFSSVPFFSSVE